MSIMELCMQKMKREVAVDLRLTYIEASDCRARLVA